MSRREKPKKTGSPLVSAKSPTISEKKKSSVPKDGSARYNQRLLVLDEIITTEDHYVHDLGVCIAVYLKPLRESGLLATNLIFDIFSNMELLASLNHDISKKLTSRLEETGGEVAEGMMIADVFISYAEQLVGAYSVYCNQHFKALDLLIAQQKKSEKLSSFLEQQRSSEAEAEGLSLRDFLIKPVQRICKYPLLFRELVKHTSEDHPDYENLRDALVILEKVTTLINERKREAENEEKMAQVLTIVSGYPGPLRTATRWFVKSGTLIKYNKVMKAQPRMFFLFSDLLIYCAEKGGGKYQYKGDIPLDASLVSEIPGGVHSGKDIPFGFQVMRADTKRTYPLAARSDLEKEDWIKAIDGVIQKTFAKLKSEPVVPLAAPQDIIDSGISRIASNRQHSMSGSASSLPAVNAIRPASQEAASSNVNANTTTNGAIDSSAAPTGDSAHGDRMASVGDSSVGGTEGGEDAFDATAALMGGSADSGALIQSLLGEISGLREKLENGRSARQRLAVTQEQLVKDLIKERTAREELERQVATLKTSLDSVLERLVIVERHAKESAADKFYSGSGRSGGGGSASSNGGSSRDLLSKRSSNISQMANLKEMLKETEATPAAEMESPSPTSEKESRRKKKAHKEDEPAPAAGAPELPSRE